MEALTFFLLVVFCLLPYLWLFYKEVNFRVRLLMASMTTLGIFGLLWIAIYWGWQSIVPLAYGYIGCMWLVFIINFSVMFISWVYGKLRRC